MLFEAFSVVFFFNVEQHCFAFPHATMLDKKVRTPSKFLPPQTFNVDNQMIFPFLLERTPHFPALIRGDEGYVRNSAQVSQIRLAGIVATAPSL